MFLLLGDSCTGANSNKAGAELQRVKLYENAINLNPRRLAAYERLTEALFDVEAPTAEDAKFLELGVKAFPDEDWIKVGVAEVAYRQGQRDKALGGIDQALRSNGTLDGSQREFATNLRRNWYLREMNTEVRAAIEKRDFAAAHKTMETYRSRVAGYAPAEAQLQAMQSSVECFELVDRAEQERKMGRKAEAAATLDKLLQRSDLPPELRRYAERLAQQVSATAMQTYLSSV
jgi:tetratricopeptide (TPR) repeat protein